MDIIFEENKPGMNRNRMHCLIYRIRRTGVQVNTQERTVYLPAGELDGRSADRKLRRLRNEFHFVVQLQIV
jgi:hypothetical protein